MQKYRLTVEFSFSSYVGENVCLHPSLDNTSRLIKIAHNEGKDVLFVGDPHVLHYSGKLFFESNKFSLIQFF